MDTLIPFLTGWEFPITLFIILLSLVSLLKVSHIRIGDLIVVERNSDLYKQKQDHIELVLVSGFQEFLSDANLVLKEFLEELEKHHLQWFIEVLKDQGMDHNNIRNHIEVIRYEDILGLALRKVVIPRFFTIFFRNHIPNRKELLSSDSVKKEKVLSWYKEKQHDTFDMSQTFIAKNWPVGAITHGEFLAHCNQYLDTTLFPELIDMFQSVRLKRESIIEQILEEVPELNKTLISKRWKELFILMGYTDILEG